MEQIANVANAVSTPANEAANVASNVVANVSANEAPANVAANVAANEVANVSANAAPEPRSEKRIKQLLSQRKQAEADAEYWRSQAQAKPAEQNELPKVEDFQNYDDFLVAKTAHAVRQTTVQEQAKIAQKRAQDAVTEVFQARVEKAAETNPEIMEIMNDRTFLPGNNPMSHVIAAVIKESEMAPELMQHLYDNSDELQKMYRMTPTAAAKEIGKLEFKLSTQQKPIIQRVSQAPEPITPLTPKGPQVVELDKLPIDDFMKKRNQEQFGKK